ncbi:MAG: class I SAM-dependent methyltransferase [Pseudomonadota bacterium]
MPDPKTIATYDAKADEYIKLTGRDKPDASLQAFIDLMPDGGHVLDLGCGPATASAHMRAVGLVPDPVDASQGMVDIANQTHDIGARLATFDDISGKDIYDGVWANFSLLHAPRDALPRHLTALHNALRPAGTLHIAMKTGTGAERDAIDRLYTYVTVAELKELLAHAGFRVTHTHEGTERGMAGTIDPFVVMRARKDA